MKTDELREKYLAFFETKGHTRRPSDVLVPTWDPSVLFTPAGMNQFKDHFLGKVKVDFTRATTCQKCLRTGDIENVGRTPYHHTFFEMLGNFSFGDYFKRDAIRWAWEFLTDKAWLGLNADQLSVTVYRDDDEAAEIWAQDIKLPSQRIVRMDEDENFWPASAPSQGPDGVCGPCSEIYYHPDNSSAAGDSAVEIWNLVFTQFNRVGDPPDNLRPLPSKNIDTGMGLERTASTLQGVETNFHIDILRPLVEAAAEVCGVPYEFASDNGRRLRRIADHIRACTFAVHENVYPGSNKEKYVIKRLLRRAVLDGHQMGTRQPFLYQLVQPVADTMRLPYPELGETVDRVARVIRQEEENFFATIDDGLERIDRIFDQLRSSAKVRVDGAMAAELYQTYGVPPELLESLAEERNLAFDWESYRRAMEAHGEASGKVVHTVMGATGPLDALQKAVAATRFLGYEMNEAEATIQGIVVGQDVLARLAERLTATDAAEATQVVLDRTPFYAESGGQVGDTGKLLGKDFEFEVTDTQRVGQLIVHHGRLVRGTMPEAAQVRAQVDVARRDAIRRAHSATHILHHALQQHLGTHAQQQGSKVDADWLRFDFTNLEPVPAERLATIEGDVTARVQAAQPIRWQTLPLADARAAGAMMLFGEKYPDPVRMVSMGEFSKELCGGTHLTNTSQVEAFEILHEEAVASGTRRVVAVTGQQAALHRQQTTATLEEAAAVLEIAVTEVPDAVSALMQQRRDLKKQVTSGSQRPLLRDPPAAGSRPAADRGAPTYEQLRAKLSAAAHTLAVAPQKVPERIRAIQAELTQLQRQLDTRQAAGPLTPESLLESAESVLGAQVVVQEVPGAESGLMRQLIDQLRQTAGAVAVLLAAKQESGKVVLVAGVSRGLVEQGVHAGNWIRKVASILGGGGGGRPDLAEAGGKHADKLPEALAAARQEIADVLAAR